MCRQKEYPAVNALSVRSRLVLVPKQRGLCDSRYNKVCLKCLSHSILFFVCDLNI